MRQWHQGKEGFMKVTRIQDKYNPDKVWMIKRYLCGTFYVNQEIKGQKFYDRDRRMTKRMLVSIGVLASFRCSLAWKFYGDEGSAAITDSMSLDILNPDKLKELVGEGVYKMKVKEETKTTYKFDSKFEKAMKAIFTGDYTFETTLEEFLDEMSIKPDDKQKKLLLKKLKGEFEKDKETLISVLVPEGETVPDFDVELWYIYRIKNGELIKAFLPEEMIDAIIEGIRKSIFVETKTSITLDYDDTEKED